MRQYTRWTLVTAAGAVLVAGQFLGAGTQVEPPATQPSTDVQNDGEPTTRPDRERGDRRGWGAMRDRQGGYMQNRPGDSYQSDDPPSEEDWAEIVEFYKSNSPVRLEMYEKLAESFGPESRRVISARKRMAGRFRDLQALKDRHADMYEFGLKQAILEDQVLGTLRDMHAADNEEPLRAKLRDLVKSYVSNFLDEREARLKRLQEMVEKETDTIQRDRASIDKLVEKQTERFQNEMTRMVEFFEDPEGWRRQNAPPQ